MTRQEHLKFCKTCLNRDFDPRKGIVCKLTNDIANFEIECKNFKVDLIEQKKEEDKQTEERLEKEGSSMHWGYAILLSGLGFARAAMKGFDDVFGIIFFVLGIGWLIIAIASKAGKNI